MASKKSSFNCSQKEFSASRVNAVTFPVPSNKIPVNSNNILNGRAWNSKIPQPTTYEMSILELSTAKVKNIARNSSTVTSYKLPTSTYLPSKLTQTIKPLKFTKAAAGSTSKLSAAPNAKIISTIARYDQYYEPSNNTVVSQATSRNASGKSHKNKTQRTTQLLGHGGLSAHHMTSSSTSTGNRKQQHIATDPAQHRRLSVSSIKLPVKIYDTKNPIFASKLSSRRRGTINQPRQPDVANNKEKKAVKILKCADATPLNIPPLKIPSITDSAASNDQCSVINFAFPLSEQPQEELKSTMARSAKSARSWNHFKSIQRSNSSGGTSRKNPLTPTHAAINYLNLPSIMDGISPSKSSIMKTSSTKLSHPSRSATFSPSSAVATYHKLSPSSAIQHHPTPMQVIISPKSVSLSVDNTIPNRLCVLSPYTKAFMASPALTSSKPKHQSTIKESSTARRNLATPPSDGDSISRSLSGRSSAVKSSIANPSMKVITGLELNTNEQKSTSKDSLFPCSFSVRKKLMGQGDDVYMYAAGINPRTNIIPFGDHNMPLSERMLHRSEYVYYPLRLISNIGWPTDGKQHKEQQKQQQKGGSSSRNNWKQIRPPAALSARVTIAPPSATGRKVDSDNQPSDSSSDAMKDIPLYNSTPSNLVIEGNRNPDPHFSTAINHNYKFKNCFKLQNFTIKADDSFHDDSYWRPPHKTKEDQPSLLKVSSAKIFDKEELSASKEYLKNEQLFIGKQKGSNKQPSDSFSYANVTDISPSLKKKIMQLHGHQCGTIRKEKKIINRKIGKSYKPKVVISC